MRRVMRCFAGSWARTLMGAALIVATVACGHNPNQPLVTLPPAETPLLETILDIDAQQLIPFDAAGDYYRVNTNTLNRAFLRLRAPWPSDLTVAIDGTALPKVNDTAAHPELAASGYYRVDGPDPIHAADPLFFWRVYVVLPQSKRAVSSVITFAVTDISQNTQLTGTAKESAPLLITLRPFDPTLNQRKSSELFFSGDNQKHPLAALIARDIIVAGWIANPLGRGGNSDGSTEDVHFGLWLDADFITRNYVGVHTLDNAIIPGRKYTDLANVVCHPTEQMPLTNGNPPNVTTFLLPGLDNLNVEQNAWHVSKRGAPPFGWFVDSTSGHSDDAYTQILTLPEPLTQPYNEGDYVEMIGVLIEDSAHLHFGSSLSPCPDGTPPTMLDWRHKCWNGLFSGNAGWLELHPFDAMRRVRAPAVRKHVSMVQMCDIRNESTPLPREINTSLTPMDGNPPTANSILRFEEIIDPRFTDMSTVSKHVVEITACEPTKLHVNIAINSGGHYLASYKLWWDEGGQPRPTPPQCNYTPATNPEPVDLPICNKKPYLPQCDPLKDNTE